MSFEKWLESLHRMRCCNNEHYTDDDLRSAYEAGLHADVHTDNSAVIAELEAQIEEMKGCYNCRYGEDDSVSFPCTRCNRCIPEVIREGDTDKWELRR